MGWTELIGPHFTYKFVDTQKIILPFLGISEKENKYQAAKMVV